MKKALLLFIALVLVNLGLTAQNRNTPYKTTQGQDVIHHSTDPEMASQFVQGEITIKLKPGAGEFGRQTGMVRFGIQTLDEKAGRFEVYQLDKRFRYNPAKLKAGLPDLSRIYKISFPGKYLLDDVVESFLSDSNVEYAEAIPVCHTTEVPSDSLYSQCQHLAQIFAP